MKKYIIGYIIGAIMFGFIGVVAGSYKAKDVTYTPSDSTWNVKNVKTALDNIKQTDKTQIANLQSAIQNKQATIDEMLLTYKNLNTQTTATASDIISGKTAYNSDGTLITGTYDNNLTFSTPQYNQSMGGNIASRTASLNLTKGKYIVNLIRGVGSAATNKMNTSEEITLELTCNSCTKTRISGGSYVITGDTNFTTNAYLLGITQNTTYYVSINSNSDTLSYTATTEANTAIASTVAIQASKIN